MRNERSLGYEVEYGVIDRKSAALEKNLIESIDGNFNCKFLIRVLKTGLKSLGL